MRILALALALAIALSLPSAGLAQDEAAPAPTPTSPRYQWHTVADGVMRVDTETGAMDLCSSEGTGEGWGCTEVSPATRSSGTPDAEVAELRSALEEAREERDRLRAALADIAAAAGAAAGEVEGPNRTLAERTRREIDEAIGVTDYALRRLMELYRGLEGEDAASPAQ